MVSLEDADEFNSHSLRGAIDRDALIEFRDAVEDLEPLASAELDDYLDPDELNIFLDDGIDHSTGGRFDVRWTTVNDYNIHYSGVGGLGFRWDVHPHEYSAPSGDAHFHPPIDASNDDEDVEESCIEVSKVELVARATVKCWRVAYDAGSFDVLNDLADPP